MRAMLAVFHVDDHNHEGVILLFQRHLLTPNLFPKKFKPVVSKLKKLREDADFGDFVTISKTQADRELHNADDFLRAADESLAQILTGRRRIKRKT
jgi:uncharacterized protein (UPF0332 family)